MDAVGNTEDGVWYMIEELTVGYVVIYCRPQDNFRQRKVALDLADVLDILRGFGVKVPLIPEGVH